MTENNNVVYSSAVIDFVATAVEFCSFLENDSYPSRLEFIEKTLKIIPVLYSKATLLPETELLEDDETESFVKEDDYSRVVALISNVMGEEDVYLDVFIEDMKYSDTPISSFVSEDIADIYQDVRNFITIYQYNLSDQMNNALYMCRENFRTYWGQKLVNVIRPLHSLLYVVNELEEEID